MLSLDLQWLLELVCTVLEETSRSEESCCTSRNGCSFGLMWFYHVNSLVHTEHFLMAFHQTACSHMQGHARTFTCQGTV